MYDKPNSYSQKDESKPIPESNVSLKYMAWNVKEMSEHMKTLTLIMKSIEESIRHIANSVNSKAKTNSMMENPPF